jgi:hypothetical protein
MVYAGWTALLCCGVCDDGVKCAGGAAGRSEAVAGFYSWVDGRAVRGLCTAKRLMRVQPGGGISKQRITRVGLDVVTEASTPRTKTFLLSRSQQTAVRTTLGLC